MRSLPRIAALGVVLLASGPLPADDEFDWMVAPYFWLPGISVDQSGNPDSGGGGGISASDILEKTESVFMFRFEAARKRWGLTVDYITLGLADQTTLSARPPFDVSVDIDGELDLDVTEVAAFYRPTANIAGVNYLLGVRRISTAKTLFITPSFAERVRVDTDTDVTDVFLGARYVHQFGDRWDASVRGDYSFGDSEGTLNLLASVGFRIAGPFALQLGYRYASIEYEEEVEMAAVTTEITLDGPYLGFVFRW
jgi:hypothetical protein